MTETRQLLVEIGSEELPPKALRRLSDAFLHGVLDGLQKAQIGHGQAQAYCTPRRLALAIQDLALAQPDREQEKRGPALAAARTPAGDPTPAALGFARSCGVGVEALDTLTTDQGSWLCYRLREAGRATADLLPEIVNASLHKLPIPKRMRWGQSTVEFVRPVHWVVMLLGHEIVAGEVLGITAGRHTRGHRFHHPASIELADAGQYAHVLEHTGQVLPDHEQRRGLIAAQVTAAALSLGGQAVIDPDLLDEVAALVEWPVVVTGGFDAKFLDIPAEILIATMKDQQRYFHVVDAEQRLLAFFVTVANIASSEPETIRRGNERVVTPRLTDAAFFWNTDRKTALQCRREHLHGVVFQKQLGTVFAKSERVARLAAALAAAIGGDPALAQRAGELAKCDLLSNLVGEFPELQGTMGRYFALHDGEHPEVAGAIEDHYRPRFAGDHLPQTKTGTALALAEKLDTLVGIFGIGQVPTGDKDPFALRRAGLGVLRLIIENELDLDLAHWLQVAAANFVGVFDAGPVAAKVMEFLWERLRSYLLSAEVTADTFEAVLARRPTRPLDFQRRLLAVAAFRRLDESASLAAANKRIGNILRQSAGDVQQAWLAEHLVEPAEKKLAEALNLVRVEVRRLLDTGDYTGALRALAGLRTEIDTFFDAVLVFAEDPNLRSNRVALLREIHALFMDVADVSQLQWVAGVEAVDATQPGSA
jgi:glycyl-tRNA synthetase beta chain